MNSDGLAQEPEDWSATPAVPVDGLLQYLAGDGRQLPRRNHGGQSL